MPGHGLLVWHIDYVASAWEENSVNNNEAHPYVDVVEADGTQNVLSQGGDAFPGSASVSSLVLKSWASLQAGPELYGIEESGDALLFNTRGGSPATEPVLSPLITPRAQGLARYYRLDGRQAYRKGP